MMKEKQRWRVAAAAWPWGGLPSLWGCIYLDVFSGCCQQTSRWDSCLFSSPLSMGRSDIAIVGSKFSLSEEKQAWGCAMLALIGLRGSLYSQLLPSPLGWDLLRWAGKPPWRWTSPSRVSGSHRAHKAGSRAWLGLLGLCTVGTSLFRWKVQG